MTVRVDGKVVEIESPRDTLRIDAGGHELEVTKDGFTTWTQRFRVFRNGKVELAAELKAADGAVPASSAAAARTTEDFALRFDGRSSFVEIPTLNFDPARPLTIEAWAEPKNLADHPLLIALNGAAQRVKVQFHPPRWRAAPSSSKSRRPPTRRRGGRR